MRGPDRDPDEMGEFYAEDAVVASPIFGTLRGKAQIRAAWDNLFKASQQLLLTLKMC